MKHSTPECAESVFPPERLALAERYVELLGSVGIERGLIGPREGERLWDRHVLNSVVIAELIGEGLGVADLGSGAGLPGLPLSLARPDLQVTLVEPLERRSQFLHEVVAELGLTNVTVLRARAEEVTERFDVVTSRALAPIRKLLTWSLPLVQRGGVVLALKGASAPDEVREVAADLRRAGAGPAEVLHLAAAPGLSTTTVVRVSVGPDGWVGWTVPSPRAAARRSSRSTSKTGASVGRKGSSTKRSARGQSGTSQPRGKQK